MPHAQISRRVIQAPRVPNGEQPVFDLDLEPYHEVLSVDIRSTVDLLGRSGERKTTDWTCVATILSRHGEATNEQEQ